MIQKEVTAQVPEKKDSDGVVTQVALGPVTVIIDYPDSFEEALGWCSEEAMLSNAFANYKVSPVQATIRSSLKAGKNEDEIQTECEGLRMGVARQGGGKVDVQAAFIAKFRTSTPEVQAEMLATLRDAAAQD